MADLEGVFTAYGPLDHRQFLDSLKDLEFQDPDWLYMPVAEDSMPWQGDLLPQAEIHFTDSEGRAARYAGEAMVLSHGCDVVPEQDEVAVLAPVWRVADYLGRLDADEEQRASKRVDLERNRMTNLFFLPGHEDSVPNRVVNFSFGGPVSTARITNIYEATDPADILRLSDNGWYLFTGKLAHHFVREEDSGDFPRE